MGQNIGTGNGTLTAFQLTKTYVSGSNTYVREIKKPVTGTVKIYLNSLLQGSGFTIDHTTGIVTFTIAPGAGVAVTADCDFDVPVRFDTDMLSVRIDGPAQYLWDSIPIVETRI